MSDSGLQVARVGVYRPGDVLLGKYELVKPIAQGGMGVVWCARNRVLDVDVALKITHRPNPEASDSASAALVRRAVTEARLAAQLAHPAVCRVLDFGLTDPGDACVVTELLQGETLDNVLAEQGRVAPAAAATMLLPILDGLSAAHAQGVVHRDVKPANIFLARDSQGHVQPKLLDFGIARCTRQAERKTTTGAIFGTPCYMSPEQARGSGEVDYRSDLWSICTTLYELISGQPPFDGENYNAVLWAVQNTEPPGLDTLALADATFAGIVARGLRKHPEQRWGSAAELGEALTHWLLAQGVELDACGFSLRARLAQAENKEARHASTRVRERPARSVSTADTVSQPGPWVRSVLRPKRGPAVAVCALLALGGSWLAMKAASDDPVRAPQAERAEPSVTLRASKPGEAREASRVAAAAPLPTASALPEPSSSAASTPIPPIAITPSRPRHVAASTPPAPRARELLPMDPPPAPTVPPAVAQLKPIKPWATADAPAAAPPASAQKPAPPAKGPTKPGRRNSLGYDFGL